MRDRIIDLMVAVAREDHRAMVDAVYAVATPTKKVDRNAFEADVARLTDKYLGKRLGDIDFARITADLASVSMKYGLEVPPDFLMMGKALMTVEGIGKEIHPELDVWTELRPYFVKLVRERYSPERLGKDALRALNQLRANAGQLPGQINDILNDLRAGRLTLQTVDPGVAAASDRLGRRLFSGIVSASLLGAGTALLIAGVHGGLATGFLVAAAALVALHLRADWQRRDKR
jgi:ubiquinone biosynthesis protein